MNKMMVETEKAISVGSEETEWLPMAVEGHVTGKTDMQEQGPALPHLRTSGLPKSPGVSAGYIKVHQEQDVKVLFHHAPFMPASAPITGDL